MIQKTHRKWLKRFFPFLWIFCVNILRFALVDGEACHSIAYVKLNRKTHFDTDSESVIHVSEANACLLKQLISLNERVILKSMANERNQIVLTEPSNGTIKLIDNFLPSACI